MGCYTCGLRMSIEPNSGRSWRHYFGEKSPGLHFAVSEVFSGRESGCHVGVCSAWLRLPGSRDSGWTEAFCPLFHVLSAGNTHIL